MAVVIYETEALRYTTIRASGISFRYHDPGEQIPWTMNLQQVDDRAVDSLIAIMQPGIKDGWFLTALSHDRVVAFFNDAVFSFDVAQNGRSTPEVRSHNSIEYLAFQNHGKGKGLTDDNVDLATWVMRCNNWSAQYRHGQPMFRVEYAVESLQPQFLDGVVRAFPPIAAEKTTSGGVEFVSYLAEIPNSRLDEFISTFAEALKPREWYALAIGQDPQYPETMQSVCVLPGGRTFTIRSQNGLSLDSADEELASAAMAIGVSAEGANVIRWTPEILGKWHRLVPPVLNNSRTLDGLELSQTAIDSSRNFA